MSSVMPDLWLEDVSPSLGWYQIVLLGDRGTFEQLVTFRLQIQCHQWHQVNLFICT